MMQATPNVTGHIACSACRIRYACTSAQHLLRQQSRSDQKIDAAVATNMERNAAHRQPPAPCLY